LLIILTAILGVLLTVAGVAGVWMAMRTSQHAQTVRNFREASASWREKAEATSADLATVHEEMAELRQQYDRLLAEHEVLKNVITGKSALEALGVQVEQAKTDIVLEVRLSKEALEHLIGGNSHD
jgi:uncharacterized coiled-coil DUF342 family protein